MTCTHRIVGYDLARGLAVMGMVLVNFEVVMAADSGEPEWLAWCLARLHGRAAALFVVLAGVGVSLISKRPRDAADEESIGAVRLRLLKRAAILFCVGLAYYPLWPGDILRFYGAYFAIGAVMVTASGRVLWTSAVCSVGLFMTLLFLLDYEAGWDWTTLHYTDFWTPSGFVRNLFFNGFHPVFPWVSFFLIGMWLGRLDLNNETLRKRVLLIALTIAVAAELFSWVVVSGILAFDPAANRQDVIAILGTTPMPPLPLYLLAGGSTAIAMTCICLALAERFADRGWLQPLISTGRMALTIYVAHVVIGMGILGVWGRLERQSLPFAAFSALSFCVSSLLFAHVWQKRFQHGPLEWIVRRIS